jgi:hypothetical protein
VVSRGKHWPVRPRNLLLSLSFATLWLQLTSPALHTHGSLAMVCAEASRGPRHALDFRPLVAAVLLMSGYSMLSSNPTIRWCRCRTPYPGDPIRHMLLLLTAELTSQRSAPLLLPILLQRRQRLLRPAAGASRLPLPAASIHAVGLLALLTYDYDQQ